MIVACSAFRSPPTALRIVSGIASGNFFLTFEDAPHHAVQA
jgi:hypothetical protein